MPQSPTANMGLIQPTEGGDANDWDVLLTAVFGLIDAHDHTTGKGVKVPTAGLNINADLSFAGAYALTNLLAADFTPVAATSVSSYAGALFVNSSDSNNLYWRTPSGTNVKVIDGTTLNVAGFAGGIGGDYSTAGALVDYVAASDIYRFRGPNPGGGRPWEAIASGHHDFYEQASTAANRVRIQSPAALAASYALTLWAALPGSTVAVQLSSAGVLTASNTFATGLTLTTGYVHLVAQQQAACVPIKGAGSFSTAIVSDQPEVVVAATSSTAVFPLEFGLDENSVIISITLYGYTLASQPTITFNYSGTNATYTTSGTYGTGVTAKTYTFDTPIDVDLNSINVKVVSGTNDFHLVRASAAWTRP